MINKAVIVGRLARDPELKKTTTGKSTCNFNLACERDIKRDGAQNVDFLNCVAWDKHADVITHYCGKGSLIGITGRIQTRNYNDKSGRKVYVTEILVETVQLINTNKLDQDGSQAQNDAENSVDIDPDDLPF